MKPIGDGYHYGYLMAGTGAARFHRMTILERIRLRRRRKRVDDLFNIR